MRAPRPSVAPSRVASQGPQPDHPDGRDRGAHEHLGDDGHPRHLLRKISRVVRDIRSVGDVVAGRRGELGQEGGPGEAVRAPGGGRRRVDPAHRHRQTQQADQRQVDPEQYLIGPVQPVMPPDGQGGGHKAHPGGRQRRAHAPSRRQTVGDQDHIDHIEADIGQQGARQGYDHATIAELRSGLDHLRQAQFRPLGGVGGHEHRAEHDAQGARHHGPGQGEVQGRSHEAQSDGDEVEIAHEPERPLVADPPVALAQRHIVDGPRLHGHTGDIPGPHASLSAS
jgi:hypothetical protein